MTFYCVCPVRAFFYFAMLFPSECTLMLYI